jgi:hypothetical protein
VKYKPSFVVQSQSFKDVPSFDCQYFNGRFMFTLNEKMVETLLMANDAAGEVFNCVFSVRLTQQQQEIVSKISQEQTNEALFSLHRELGRPTSVIQMNPQMALLFVQMMAKDGLDFAFQFEANWKGAEILRDMCQNAESKFAYMLGRELDDLIEDLRARKAEWDNAEAPPPKGYISNK